MSRLDLVALVVANMVGVGVFTTSGLALGSIGDPWVLVALWAVGGAYAMLGAVVYGALASAHPGNGGEHHLLRRLGRPELGFAAGVVSLTAGFAGPLAAAAHGLDAYLGPGSGGVALLGAGVLHAWRGALGLRVQTVAVLAKVGLVVAVVMVAASTTDTPPAPSGLVDPGAAFGVLVWITFSYTGFNAAVYLAGEHAPKDVARAGVIGAGVVTVIYLGLNAVFVLSGPVADVIGRVDVAVASAERDGPLAVAVTRGLAGIALVTSVSSLAVAGGRVVQSMARASDLTALAVPLSERPGPGVAIITGLAAVGYLFAGLPAILGWAGWMLAGSSALTIGRGLQRGVFDTPLSRAAGVVFVGGTVAVLVGSALHAPIEAAVAAGGFAVAVLVHRALARSG